MVKGTSRQVIMVHSPETKMFEQAIFILREDALGEGISDDLLLKEAQKAIHGSDKREKRRHLFLYGFVWMGLGAFLMGMVWLVTAIL